jgi:hypothetical protein
MRVPLVRNWRGAKLVDVREHHADRRPLVALGRSPRAKSVEAASELEDVFGRVRRLRGRETGADAADLAADFLHAGVFGRDLRDGVEEQVSRPGRLLGWSDCCRRFVRRHTRRRRKGLILGLAMALAMGRMFRTCFRVVSGFFPHLLPASLRLLSARLRSIGTVYIRTLADRTTATLVGRAVVPIAVIVGDEHPIGAGDALAARPVLEPSGVDRLSPDAVEGVDRAEAQERQELVVEEGHGPAIAPSILGEADVGQQPARLRADLVRQADFAQEPTEAVSEKPRALRVRGRVHRAIHPCVDQVNAPGTGPGAGRVHRPGVEPGRRRSTIPLRLSVSLPCGS